MTPIKFNPKQKEVLRNGHKSFNFLCGAVRSGKTFVSYFMIIMHIREHWDNECYFCGKTLSTLDRNIFEPMRKLFGEDNVSKIYNNNYIIIFGKKCWCVGANDDRAVTKIQGGSAGYFYCDEIVTYPENFFEMMLSRLDKEGSMCDATCNPESPSHFIKQWLDKPDNQKYIYQKQFTIYDNDNLPREVIHRLEDMYRGTIYFDRWILGKWVRSEGLVFPTFKREKHYLTPDEYAKKIGSQMNNIRYCIIGCDGATTNDATTLCPLLVFDTGKAVVGDVFYHDPKTNGQFSNAELVRYMQLWLDELVKKYDLMANGVSFYTVVDCAASDLVITMQKNLPKWMNVHPFTKKDQLATSDVVNNALALDMVHIFDFGGYKNYIRHQWIEGLNPLVVELETMIWDDKKADHYDDSVPNDMADAFRYALCCYFNNPDNLWITPKFE